MRVAKRMPASSWVVVAEERHTYQDLRIRTFSLRRERTEPFAGFQAAKKRLIVGFP